MTPQLKQHLARRPNGRIYHYSSRVGLQGILSSKEMWATKIQFMNDADEFKHGLELAEEVLVKRGKGIPSCSNTVAILKERLHSIQHTNIFLACFSEEGDLLSQWRGYCPAGGFSLGIRYDDLKRLTDPQDWFIGKCIYDHPTKIVLLAEIIDEVLRKAAEQPQDRDDSLFDEFVADLWMVVPLLKSPAFQEEKEWRVISYPKAIKDKSAGLRDGKTTLIPYYRLKLEIDGASALSGVEIIVGPNPNMDLAIEAARALTESRGIVSEIRSSSVPFRGL